MEREPCMIARIEAFSWFTGFKVEVAIFASILGCTNHPWLYKLSLTLVECDIEMYIYMKTCVNKTARKN